MTHTQSSSSSQPDPSKTCIRRITTELSDFNVDLVIQHFYKDQYDEYKKLLQNKVDTYTEQVVMSAFCENISTLDYSIKFEELLLRNFTVEEVKLLDDLLRKPKQDPTISGLVAKLLIDYKDLAGIIEEIFEEAVEKTKKEFTRPS